MENYWKKYNEAEFNLNQIQELFYNRDRNLEFSINNFLSSSQSIFWMLNKTFNSYDGYETWKNNRSTRLCQEAKIFKELRNISLKEYPIEHSGIIIGYKLEPGLPAGATFTSPWVDTLTGKLMSTKCTVTTKEGNEYEVDAIEIHDFLVTAISDSKEYKIETFILKATEYLRSIKTEIESTEGIFKKK